MASFKGNYCSLVVAGYLMFCIMGQIDRFRTGCTSDRECIEYASMHSGQILNKAAIATQVGVSEPTVQRWLSVPFPLTIGT